MAKWIKAKPGHYVGVDHSAASVKEAIRRNKENKAFPFSFPAIFIDADCGDDQNLISDIFSRVICDKIYFDIVST